MIMTNSSPLARRMRRSAGALAGWVGALALAAAALHLTSTSAAEAAVKIPRAGVDLSTDAPARRDRGVRRRLLLGRAGRVPARQGRDPGRLGLRRRREQTAHYETVGSGTTGHAESVQITFDPKQISYGSCCRSTSRSRTIRPSSIARARIRGTQYRSAIFYADATQKQIGRALHRAARRGEGLPGQDRHADRAVDGFYPAEDYHQDYATLHPDSATSRVRPAEDRRTSRACSRAVPRPAGAGAARAATATRAGQ